MTVNSVSAFAWLLLSGVFFACGEYLSKKWGMNPSWPFAITIGVIYGIGGLVWLPALLYKNELATIGVAWEVLAATMTVAIGVLIFHEHVSAMHWLGIALALTGLLLVWTA